MLASLVGATVACASPDEPTRTCGECDPGDRAVSTAGVVAGYASAQAADALTISPKPRLASVRRYSTRGGLTRTATAGV
jgi:hypothetical protein